MPDWHGTTGRDDLVGGGNFTQFSTTIDGITLCSVQPFTDEEVEALREYFRLLAEKRKPPEPPPVCVGCPHPPHVGYCLVRVQPPDVGQARCACFSGHR